MFLGNCQKLKDYYSVLKAFYSLLIPGHFDIRVTKGSNMLPKLSLFRFLLPILIIHSASPVGWRVTFKVVDTLTGSSSLAGRPFEEQPHKLYRKWKVYTGN